MSDIIGTIFEQLKNFGLWLADFINGILSNIANLVFNSIVNFFAGMFNALKWIIDSAFRWMLDVVNSLIIAPAQGLIANAVAFMQKKLFGTVYIILLMKLYDMEIKSFVEKPDLRKIGMMLLKPFLLYFALSVMWNVVFPTFKTLGIQTEVTPPPVQIIPPGIPQDVTTKPPTEYIKPELKLEDNISTDTSLKVTKTVYMEITDAVITLPDITTLLVAPIETSDKIDFTTSISTVEHVTSSTTDVVLTYADISVISPGNIQYSDIIDNKTSITITPYAYALITDNIDTSTEMTTQTYPYASTTDDVSPLVSLSTAQLGYIATEDKIWFNVTLEKSCEQSINDTTWTPTGGWTKAYDFNDYNEVLNAFRNTAYADWYDGVVTVSVPMDMQYVTLYNTIYDNVPPIGRFATRVKFELGTGIYESYYGFRFVLDLVDKGGIEFILQIKSSDRIFELWDTVSNTRVPFQSYSEWFTRVVDTQLSGQPRVVVYDCDFKQVASMNLSTRTSSTNELTYEYYGYNKYTNVPITTRIDWIAWKEVQQEYTYTWTFDSMQKVETFIIPTTTRE
jgi:hypothetical protein